MSSLHLTLAPADAPNNTRRLTPAFQGFAWLSNRKIVYSSQTNGNTLWLINADGSEHQQLTYNEANLNPATTPNGKFIVFVPSRGETYHIWRMNSDGSNKIQLTNGEGEFAPFLHPKN